ncbi:MAG TPA: TIM-barrel domain-containing protein [Opitutaceae bacterium]|jgi:alpha-glucosidase
MARRALAAALIIAFSPRMVSLHAQGRAFDPAADPAAEVVDGNVRITVLTARLLRLEWSPAGAFEDHASLVFLNRRLPVPPFEVRRGGHGELWLRTKYLKLHYAPGADGDSKFTAENLSIDLTVSGSAASWHPGLSDPENLLGTTRTLDRARGSRTIEPIGPGLISRRGWALVDDSERPLFDSADFSFARGEASPWPWLLQRPPGPRQDWYFFGYGHDYRAALGDYVRVAGRIPLPPRFAFGAWWSRYWAYSDQELDELVRGFRENDVPLDVLVIDMDWHKTFLDAPPVNDASGHLKGWSGYSWNRLLFPDPDQFLRRLHQEGLKVTLNLHPASGIQPWEDAYPAMARAEGIDPASGKYVPFQITDRTFAKNYFDLVHHPLERQGVDFWWLDWQQEPQTAVPGVNPTWWLNYVHFTDQEREGKRPLLFHRWGGLGNHRYQIGFSGDTRSDWESLAFQPWFTATAANVGYAYWSHDIGGHINSGNEDPELYARWVQFGVFSPILRTHTTKNGAAERRIWAYPEPYADTMRDAFQLRYALQPYLYTEARRTYDTGIALLRPLYYDWPEEAEAYQARGEYEFGSQMIAAPVTAPADPATGLASESVWLPPGPWIEWPTGQWLRGPARLERRYFLGQIPVFVRPGAIVPMAPPMRYTGEKPTDPLILTVFPGSGRGSSYSLYEDDGRGEAYRHGVLARTRIEVREKGDATTIEVEPAEGSYPGMPPTRGYEVRLVGDWPPVAATENGQRLDWHFEGNRLTTVVSVPAGPVTARRTIVVQRAAGAAARRGELDGFAGRMARYRAVYDALTRNWSATHSPDVVTDAMQAGDRIGYHPERIETELEHLRAIAPLVPAAAEAMAKSDAPLRARVTSILADDDHSP